MACCCICYRRRYYRRYYVFVPFLDSLSALTLNRQETAPLYVAQVQYNQPPPYVVY